LQNDGVKIAAYDPKAAQTAAVVLKNVDFKKNPYEVVEQADLLIILTEWNEFKELDFSKIKNLMKAPNIIDGRNLYEPEQMKAKGFNYMGIGRG
jgi:UDPglucose 6-dehydrogenase